MAISRASLGNKCIMIVICEVRELEYLAEWA